MIPLTVFLGGGDVGNGNVSDIQCCGLTLIAKIRENRIIVCLPIQACNHFNSCQ